jgi:hypothetical protein
VRRRYPTHSKSQNRPESETNENFLLLQFVREWQYLQSYSRPFSHLRENILLRFNTILFKVSTAYTTIAVTRWCMLYAVKGHLSINKSILRIFSSLLYFPTILVV